MRQYTRTQEDNPARLSPLLTGLFLPGVTAAELRIPGDPLLLFPDELRSLHNAVPKRVQEFAAGRICARRALTEHGFIGSPLGVCLGVNDDRSPQWPASIVGSITHADDQCGAVVADREQYRAIGLDMEIVGHVTAEIWPYFCTSKESNWLSALSTPNQPRCAALLFSAKEAFYKCQYAVTQQWLEFCDVALEPVFESDTAGYFLVHPQKALALQKHHSASLSGRFEFSGNTVVSGVALPTLR